MLDYLTGAVGGAIGTIGRYLIGGVVSRRFGEAFPLGTLVVNITGSFIISFFATITGPDGRWLIPGRGRALFYD